MTGLEWVKRNAGSNDDALFSLALSAAYSITVPSRIRRKALQYISTRDAFEGQLAKNSVYPQ